MTDAFDPDNAEHQKIKVSVPLHLFLLFVCASIINMNTNKDSTLQGEIEIGDGLPDIRLTTKCLEALKQAGFEVSILLQILSVSKHINIFNI